MNSSKTIENYSRAARAAAVSVRNKTEKAENNLRASESAKRLANSIKKRNNAAKQEAAIIASRFGPMPKKMGGRSRTRKNRR